MNSIDKILLDNINNKDKINSSAYTEADKSFISYSQYRILLNYVNLIPRNVNILDWGAGGGHFTKLLYVLGFSKINSYFFLNSSENLPEIASKVNSLRADQNEPVLLPYAENNFDIVFSIGVLEHVRESGGDENLSLAEIRNKLKPGGILVIYHLPNKYSWIEFVRSKCGFYSHIYKYDSKDIEELSNNGYEILYTRRYGILPRNIFRKLPLVMSNSYFLSKLYDLIDSFLSLIFFKFTQNYFIIMRKIY